MCEPESHSLTTNGPVATGFRKNFSPCCSTSFFGRMKAGRMLMLYRNAETGWVKCTLTVDVSTTSVPS